MAEAEPFVPTTDPEKSSLKKPNEVPRKNLAGDEDLCEEVQCHLDAYFLQHKSKRDAYDEIWAIADEMYKAGQNETIRESERLRLDRQGDKRTKTKAKKEGSTLFYRTIRTLAALFSDMLNSQRDPYKLSPRANEDVELPPAYIQDLADQHNMLMRYSRDQEMFGHKSIDFLVQLCKYGNVPIYSAWKQEAREILDRWPVRNAKGDILVDAETGRPKTKIERREVWVANRPEVNYVSIENFYADPDIGDMQMQNAIFVRSDANIDMIRRMARQDVYLNVDKITKQHMLDGDDDNDLRTERQVNEGLSQNSGSVNTGVFRQMECHALLPIDESKPKGKRWNAEKHEPKRYWVTIIGNSLAEKQGICVRIERNPDPDDEYPFEMISLIPDDTHKLYHVCLAQLLRSNYTETVIARSQSIDSKTLQNNRPLKVVRGEVQVDGTQDFTLSKDKIFYVDSPNSVTEFEHTSPIDNQNTLAALEQDSNDAAGTGPTVRGIPMGSRTSSSEAIGAQDAAALPHKMMAQYVFEKWLRFHARKGIRQWHLYASETQILKITDDDSVLREIRPIDLFGEFDIQITLVDDYDRDMLSQQNAAFVAQQLIPLFADVIDKREAAKQLFEKYAKMDASKFILPDNTTEQRVQAKRENQLFTLGEFVAPSLDENHTVQLIEHRQFRAALNGMENDPDWQSVIPLLDRHIAQTESLEKRVGEGQAQQPAGGQQEAPPGNQTPGEAFANQQIAGPAGAMAQLGGMA